MVDFGFDGALGFKPMSKRLRASAASGDLECFGDPLTQHARKLGGAHLREHLLEKFCLEGMPGSEVALLSHLITEAGGCGVEDLALPASSAVKHGHAHVQNNMGDIYPEVDLVYVQCPVHEKRESRRTCSGIAMYLPSKALSQYVSPDMGLDKFDRFLRGLEDFDQHPVVLRARAEGRAVRPLALYWDGVQYTNHDSFMGFYVTDVLSEQKFLSFLVRLQLSSSLRFVGKHPEALMTCANAGAGAGAHFILCF